MIDWIPSLSPWLYKICQFQNKPQHFDVDEALVSNTKEAKKRLSEVPNAYTETIRLCLFSSASRFPNPPRHSW